MVSFRAPPRAKPPRLGINILANTHRAVADTFVSKVPDKFAALDWHPGPAGSPLIDGSAASIETVIKERRPRPSSSRVPDRPR